MSIWSIVIPAKVKALGIATAGPMPIISGATPTAVWEMIFPRIGNPSHLASSLVIRMQALAPSLTWEEFPPVDLPSLLKDGFNLERPSIVVSPLIPSSFSTRIFLEFFFSSMISTLTGQISSLNNPYYWALNAFY